MRIAFLFEGDIYNPRGEFIAIHNRLKNYKTHNSVNIDAYVLWPKFNFLTKYITKSDNGNLVNVFEKDGIEYHCVWYPKSLVDGVTHKLFKHATDVEYNSIKRLIDLKSYDLISAHSLKCARIGLYYKEKYNIPFIVTWHGSSIHSLPFSDKNWYKQTAQVLRCASHNFFVSEELERIANQICPNKSTISLNGIDAELFYKYSGQKRDKVRKKLGFSATKKVVAYVGNCFPIKNVGFLPELFTKISETVPDCHFCIVGNGSFTAIFNGCNLSISYLGSIDYSEMPDYYNAFDLVVLPSINEGLPMTSLEATACGTMFIGSRVGEIEKVVGTYYTVIRDANFNESFAKKCIECLLSSPEVPSLQAKYLASDIVRNELSIIEQL